LFVRDFRRQAKGKPMSKKISPGPYKILKGHDLISVQDVNGLSVAVLDNTDNSLANARAIAEVPTMYKMLQDYERMTKQASESGFEMQAMLKDVRELLARIEGTDE